MVALSKEGVFSPLLLIKNKKADAFGHPLSAIPEGEDLSKYSFVMPGSPKII
jgi:hypothetical protein